MLTPVLITLSAVVVGGYMLLDGVRELTGRGYVAPGGRLGPWASVLQKIGIDPRSRPVAAWFAVHGLLVLLTLVCYLAGVPGSPALMGALAAAALWYLPFGTLGALVIIACLVLG